MLSGQLASVQRAVGDAGRGLVVQGRDKVDGSLVQTGSHPYHRRK